MELPSLGTAVWAGLVVLVVAMLIVVAGLFWRLWKAYSLVRDDNMPRMAKVVFVLATIYTLSPIDVLPDPILFDDIGVLVLSIGYLYKQAQDLGLLPDDDDNGDNGDNNKDNDGDDASLAAGDTDS